MIDLYELIGVPETASEVWIERSYLVARAKIEADQRITKKQRAASLSSLEVAHQTLSDPAARQAYDLRLENWREAKAKGGLVPLLRKVLVAMLIIGVIGGAGYWYRERENERIRFEEERVQSELAVKQRLAEIAEQRRKSDERLQTEAIERRQEEAARLEQAREQRAQDASTQRFVVDERYEKAQRDKKHEADRQQRQNEEMRERSESERVRRQAQVEVERQRRFVEQREREDAFAAQQREAVERNRLIQEQNKGR